MGEDTGSAEERAIKRTRESPAETAEPSDPEPDKSAPDGDDDAAAFVAAEKVYATRRKTEQERLKMMVAAERALFWAPPEMTYASETTKTDSLEVTYMVAHTMDSLQGIINGPCILGLDIDQTIIGGERRQLRRHVYRQNGSVLDDTSLFALLEERGLLHGSPAEMVKTVRLEDQVPELLSDFEVNHRTDIVFVTARNKSDQRFTEKQLFALGYRCRDDSAHRRVFCIGLERKGPAFSNHIWRRICDNNWNGGTTGAPKRAEGAHAAGPASTTTPVPCKAWEHAVFVDDVLDNLHSVRDSVRASLSHHVKKLTLVHFLGSYDMELAAEKEEERINAEIASNTASSELEFEFGGRRRLIYDTQAETLAQV